MTDSIPPKGPDDTPNEDADKPEALGVAQHTDHPLEAKLHNPPPSASAASAPASDWEREVLEKILMTMVHEQRVAHRWHIFFRFVALGLIRVFTYAFANLRGETVGTGRHIAVVTLEGKIAANTNASVENINASLQATFTDDSTVGVILKISLPDGSLVQAGMINDEIRRPRAKYKKIPLCIVVEETCVSGGYYVAAAADKVYVDRTSIVGPIDVLTDGFGSIGLVDRVGVERHLLTASSSRGVPSSSSPMSP